ncbi:unnamed protein product [Hermetia illucens]|uniref:Uncharacterized protein n=1 Tax=Hermetia illucens TaxID=343691 RepID=A0A7R8V469_HERIL|nr:unnamed protein product [Hermetia illucens]
MDASRIGLSNIQTVFKSIHNIILRVWNDGISNATILLPAVNFRTTRSRLPSIYAIERNLCASTSRGLAEIISADIKLPSK